MVTKWRSYILTLLFFLFLGGTAAAVTVQAVADRDRIGAGESLQLQLRVDGSPDGEPELASLQKDWEILSRSQSSQMQIINSSFSRSIVYSLTLMPKSKGSLTIPAVCFDQDCSLPLTIEVAENSSVANPAGEQLLLETEIAPQKSVVQGQLLLKVRLLRRVDLYNGQLSEPQPRGVEAVVKKLGDDRSYELRRDGLLYQVIERDYAIFPQGGGRLRIPPLQFDGTIAGGNSRFDPLARQGQRVRRASEPLQVEVTPLPKDLGRRPWLPAMSVTIEDDWQQQKPKFVVGEPVTRTLRLTANGFPAAQLPELKPGVPDGFKSYPDQPSREDHLSNSGIKGVLVQKTALVPTRPGRYQLPAVDLDWWNIVTGVWQQAHLDAVTIDVAPAAGTPPLSASSSAPTSGTATGVDNRSPVATPAATAVARSPSAGFWPWVTLCLAIGWLLTLLMLWRLWRRSKPSGEQSSPDLQPSEKSARKGVVQAARSGDPRATRQALRVWSQILWPGEQGRGCEPLHQAADPALLEELEALDLTLYGRAGSDWAGDNLAEMIADWQPVSTTVRATELPDLYP
jgi:hypothetical protein